MRSLPCVLERLKNLRTLDIAFSGVDANYIYLCNQLWPAFTSENLPCLEEIKFCFPFTDVIHLDCLVHALVNIPTLRRLGLAYLNVGYPINWRQLFAELGIRMKLEELYLIEPLSCGQQRCSWTWTFEQILSGNEAVRSDYWMLKTDAKVVQVVGDSEVQAGRAPRAICFGNFG
ncbi:uncharacterized protein BDZ99DRAFT_194693 [Mytilinidion resinicola]|uniref:F-box domain-containing protein n=1 Tax=Mytilinidion resinicola TaxID=574789 RepID=A0A6A6Z2K3_9PEZI|nr:uncharacterized protein BDZ99DRAFT_194693 [Mytilinidion resinicola]KAF2815366.1 hypothetical protein BDZ99DRAFT_194693 [Mytilinidion resinicola]